MLKTPESVIYDKNRDIFYIANMNLEPRKKDGNGFISRMDREGKITDLKWITCVLAILFQSPYLFTFFNKRYQIQSSKIEFSRIIRSSEPDICSRCQPFFNYNILIIRFSWKNDLFRPLLSVNKRNTFRTSLNMSTPVCRR